MRVVVFAAALFSAVITGAFAQPSSPAETTPSNPFLGSWIITDVKVGPWVKEGDEALPVDPKLMRASVTFTGSSVRGPAPLGCHKAHFEVKTVGPDFLFEGNLPHPADDARALGFKADTFPAMSFSCESGAGDLEMDYAMADRNTVMFGLNDHVYIMKRLR